jgi:D-aspartate ligase
VSIQSDYSDLTGVIVTRGAITNSLGVIRAFGRRGIPVVYLDLGGREALRYSKYITMRLEGRSSQESEAEFVKILLDFGKQLKGKMMIIPTGDSDVLALSKHKYELEKYYYLPVPTYETVQKLVNKKIFYKLLAKMDIPHPNTYFPESLTDLRKKGLEIDYPYLIKPAYCGPFYQEFDRKNLVIHSPGELFQAIDKLRNKDFEVMIQDIIPGNEIYMFYTYFNRKSEPLAVCGYDKIRQAPDDFGSGSFCRSVLRSSPVKECIRLLKALDYQGFAEPELKKDPRDGEYKLLEINARTTTQNRLAAACGVDIEYISYLEAARRLKKASLAFRSDVFWVDDVADLISCLKRLGRKEIGVGEIIRTFKTRKVHSIAAWDDPVPFIIDAIGDARDEVSESFGTLHHRGARAEYITVGSISERK